MELPQSQQSILQRLKVRGPQSVKILANQLDITTMGVRQHIAELEARGLVAQTAETRQTRGRPVHFWQLTAAGHRRFSDHHADNLAELLDVIRLELGEEQLNTLVIRQHQPLKEVYARELAEAGPALEQKLARLAQLRTEAGFMAEIRLLPDGWMLIENHCPIIKAAQHCAQYCASELDLFRTLLSEQAHVSRIDHVITGARRCAYKIMRSDSNERST